MSCGILPQQDCVNWEPEKAMNLQLIFIPIVYPAFMSNSLQRLESGIPVCHRKWGNLPWNNQPHSFKDPFYISSPVICKCYICMQNWDWLFAINILVMSEFIILVLLCQQFAVKRDFVNVWCLVKRSIVSVINTTFAMNVSLTLYKLE